ncbi:MAG: class I SAM-dependent methyltransferase [Gemmatimonadota bacterium]
MTIVGSLHGRFLLSRRARVLADRVAELCPRGATVLDVGCGDGKLALTLMALRPDLTVTGLDVLVRPHPAIPVQWFDGLTIPVESGAVAVVLLVDVVHHASDPDRLLREAVRVASQAVIIKDHLQQNRLDRLTLRLMDYVGNAAHGVALPYNYWSRERWRAAGAELGTTVRSWDERLALYPWPFSLLFGRSLHFLAALAVPERAATAGAPVPRGGRP